MTRTDKLLCVIYAVLAVAALYATWSNNLLFFQQPNNGGLVGFFAAGYTNPGAASLTNDLLFLALAGVVFMVVEARRVGVRFVWVYILLSGLLAISVMFPLFLIARQVALARRRAQP
jgi:hypothetical protein